MNMHRQDVCVAVSVQHTMLLDGHFSKCAVHNLGDVSAGSGRAASATMHQQTEHC